MGKKKKADERVHLANESFARFTKRALAGARPGYMGMGNRL